MDSAHSMTTIALMGSIAGHQISSFRFLKLFYLFLFHWFFHFVTLLSLRAIFEIESSFRGNFARQEATAPQSLLSFGASRRHLLLERLARHETPLPGEHFEVGGALCFFLGLPHQL